jgi:hypothetical protein
MNNLESVFTYEGTNEIHTLVLGALIMDYPTYQLVEGSDGGP